MKHVLVGALALALAAGVTASVCTAADPGPIPADCPDDHRYVECMAAAGDRMAVYVQGRAAYEKARESGDFSEALRLSRQLAATGDKNGERLLKMTNMQLGWGAHKDYAQAYVWLSEAIDGGDDYLVRWREMLAQKMSPEQLTQAKARLQK